MATASQTLLDQKLSPLSRQNRHAGFRRRAGHRSWLCRLQPASRSFLRPQRIRPALRASGFALLVALGFEFVNGFHDTANAVATVIYTHSLEPHIAVVWSGFWNFLGVLASSGLVAFAIVSLLPVELILQVGSKAGFAMVFALLVAAIIWNLGTWWFGLPASSSHTLIGSVIGVGIANQLINGRSGTSGVDWGQAANIGYSLLLSPIVGFACAGLAAAPRQSPYQRSQALHGSRRHRTSSLLHSLPPGSHLHRRQLLPRLQRRTKRHGPHHAHSHRHRSHRLRPQPCRHLQRFPGFHRRLHPSRRHSHQVRQPQRRHRRRPRRRYRLHPHQGFHSQHHARPPHPGQRHRQRDRSLQRNEEHPQRPRPQLPQRHVSHQRSHSPHAEERQPELFPLPTPPSSPTTKSTSITPPASFLSG